MTGTAVAANVLEAFNVRVFTPTQGPFDKVLFAVEQRRNPSDIVVGQLFSAPLRIDIRLLT